MLKYLHILNYFYSNIWAMRPDKLSVINLFLTTRAIGADINNEEIKTMTHMARSTHSHKTGENIAVLPIYGIISHRSSMMDSVSESTGASAEAISKQFTSFVEDPSVGSIILDMDSPGGTVNGVMELADQIFEARNKKKIYAVVNSQAASAAYWLASQAEELIITPSGDVGSIGVYMMHQDISERMKQDGINTTFIKAGKYKTEGNPYVSMDDEAVAAFQGKVDFHYGNFIKAVARGRGVKALDVRNGFGEGRMVTAPDALKMNMVDRIATMDDTIMLLTGAKNKKTAIHSEAEIVEMGLQEADLLQMDIDLFNFK